MYRKAEFAPLPPLDFELANGSKLSALNRWVKMAKIIPWSEFEKDYLAIAKQRQPTRNKRRQAIKKKLQYIKRNLVHIEQLMQLGATLESLSKKQYKTLLVLGR